MPPWKGTGTTVVTVWRPGQSEPDFSDVVREHPSFRPSLELYFEGSWLGLHCFRRDGDLSRFDEAMARSLIDQVRKRLPTP
jgi:hypothetical protein